MEKEHIMVCLSSSPANKKIIRSAALMAEAFSAKFTALYVDVQGEPLRDEDHRRLEENLDLAKELGARIERVDGDDIAYQIAEFARLRGVTKIVIGRSVARKRRVVRRHPLTDQLLYYAPNLEIHIIPDSTLHRNYRIINRTEMPKFTWPDIIKSLGLLCVSSLIGLLFDAVGLTSVSILPVYILTVLIIAMVTNGYAYWLLASFAAVIVYNFLFTDPRYTFLAYEADYPVTFLILFVVSFLAGNLTMRLKRAAQQSAEAAHRTKLIFDTDKMLSRVRDPEKVTEITAQQISKLTTRDVVYYMNRAGELGEPKVIRGVSDENHMDFFAPAEVEAAEWTFVHNHFSGASSSAVPYAKAQYYAIRMNDTVYGVIGAQIRGDAQDAYENSILISILGECALALENIRNANEKEEANLRMRSEQTNANLLRSISHDIRTPLTTISGNADSLRRYAFDEETRQRIYTDIYDDSMWLYNLVENLLAVSKIGSEQFQLKMTTEVLDDVIAEAIRHVDRKISEHHIDIQTGDMPVIARMDAHLIMQVIINLVNNAIKYTQTGSTITVSVFQRNADAVVEVSDDGPGINEKDLDRVFDLFFTANKNTADSRRGLGLGLALCKSIINMHGGEICAKRNQPSGTKICFTLPAEEVCDHE